LSNDNALISRSKFFLRTTKNRLLNPSEIRALEFKGEIRRLGSYSVSATIGSDRKIFDALLLRLHDQRRRKKTVTAG
jgi:hypothetical protein